MIYGSVCSGIEAASVAWHPLGWRAAFLSEIEAFPRAVLQHHYPEVPLHGDFTTIAAGQYDPIDLLVGGTPCQSFSVAGLRGGLDDDRGNLALEYLRLADRLRPRWLVWENVPGVLSSNGGRDFGSILGGMVELGYGVAYRVLDAQFFGVAQRRRRVFVVGYLGDWRRAAAVLFERHSLSGHPAPRREAGPSVAALTANGVGTCGADDNQGQAGHLIARRWPADVSPTLNAAFGSKLGLENQHIDSGAGMFVTHTLKGEGFDASEDGTGRGTPIVPCAYRVAGDGAAYREGDATAPLTTGTDSSASIVAFALRGREGGAMPEVSEDGSIGALRAASGGSSRDYVAAFTCSDQANSFAWERPFAPTLNAQVQNDTSNIQQGVRIGSAVRRLTPRECERLQGFPDDYTLITHRGKPAADGPRYKALGNSMAVPVMRWIGERIAQVDAIPQSQNEKVAA